MPRKKKDEVQEIVDDEATAEVEQENADAEAPDENAPDETETENVDNEISTASVLWPGKYGSKEEKDAWLADQTADAESRPEFDPSD